MTHPVLWHFTFSHFAEKARWALDFKGIPHVRKAFLPGLHLPLFYPLVLPPEFHCVLRAPEPERSTQRPTSLARGPVTPEEESP